MHYTMQSFLCASQRYTYHLHSTDEVTEGLKQLNNLPKFMQLKGNTIMI